MRGLSTSYYRDLEVMFRPSVCSCPENGRNLKFVVGKRARFTAIRARPVPSLPRSPTLRLTFTLAPPSPPSNASQERQETTYIITLSEK